MATWLLLAYAVVAPLSFPIPISIGDARPVDLLGGLVAGAIPLLLSGRKSLHTMGLLFPTVFYLATLYPSLFVLADSSVFFNECFRYFRFICIVGPVFLLIFIEDIEGLLKSFVTLFFFAGLLSIGIGIVGFFLGWEYTAAGQRFVYEGAYEPRAGGLFQNTGPYGNLAAIWVGISLLGAFTIWGKKFAVLVVCVVAVVSPLSLMVSMSRGGFVGIALSVPLLVLLVYKKGSGMRIRALAIASSITLLILLPMVSQFALWEILVSYLQSTAVALLAGQYEVGTADRTIMWQQAWSLFIDNSLIGVGFKALDDLYLIPPDNMLLQALSETGLLGASGLFVFVVAITSQLVARHREGSVQALGVLIIWLGEMLQAVVSDVFFYFGSMPILVAVTGIVVRQQVRTNEAMVVA